MRGENDAPLIGTLRFVLVMGVVFLVLWLGMYVTLWERW